MAFRISKRQTADQFLHAVAGSQFERALHAASRQCDAGAKLEPLAEDVHLVRRLIKRLRALIRLVAPSTGDRIEVDRLLRDAARLLADLRDAHVNTATLESIIAMVPQEIHASGIQGLISRIEAGESGKANSFDCIEINLRWKEVRKTLKLCSKVIGKWHISGIGFDPFNSGMRRTYRQARSSLIDARQSNSAESWHEFRKALKYHAAQIRLLCPMCMPLLSAHQLTAAEVAELLGRDHDLAMLLLHLNHSCESKREEFTDENIEQMGTLVKLIEREQKMLRKKSSQLAVCLLAESPKAFVSRMCEYWDCWRQGQN